MEIEEKDLFDWIDKYVRNRLNNRERAVFETRMTEDWELKENVERYKTDVLIERYVRGKLSKKEKTSLEERMKRDSQFCQEVQLEQQLMAHINNKSFKNKLNPGKASNIVLEFALPALLLALAFCLLYWIIRFH